MKIISSNEMSELKEFIFKKAKYQKVLLLYDQTTSNIEISDIYRLIREDCIFNQMDTSNIDYDEINNGYKVLIFRCCTDSFLSVNIDLEDFDNIFIPTDNAVLPYYLNADNTKITKEDNLFQNAKDIHMTSSILFNKFLHYLKSFFLNDNSYIDFSVQSEIDDLNAEIKFEDIKILKKTGLEYKYLSLIDLLIIDALLVMVTAIRTNNLLIIDAFKECKDDESLIDKLFARVYDDALINIVRLNYTKIYNVCKMTKDNILSTMDCQYFSIEDVDTVLNKLKIYAKYDDGLINYLYVFGILDNKL